MLNIFVEEEKGASIRRGGVRMEKINLPFFYQLGAQFNPLTKFTPDAKNRISIWLASFTARTFTYTTLMLFPILTVCRPVSIELINVILEAQKWMNKTPPDKWAEVNPLADQIPKAKKSGKGKTQELQESQNS